MNEMNKSFFYSLILVISCKILKIFYGIKEDLNKIKEVNSFEHIKLKTKIKIIFIYFSLYFRQCISK